MSSIGKALKDMRIQESLSQSEIAFKLNVDQSVLSRIETGEREATATVRRQLSRSSWRMALAVADEETDGYFSNILQDVPNLDLHPAALKDVLLKELAEAEAALEDLTMAKHLDPAKRKISAERVWQEIRDVIEKAAVMQGVLEDEFDLDRKRLIQRHEMEVKKGER